MGSAYKTIPKQLQTISRKQYSAAGRLYTIQVLLSIRTDEGFVDVTRDLKQLSGLPLIHSVTVLNGRPSPLSSPNSEYCTCKPQPQARRSFLLCNVPMLSQRGQR